MADNSVGEVAKQTATSVRTFLAGQVDGQINSLGQRLQETAESVRSLGDQARHDQNVALAAELADRTSAVLERAAGYLHGRKADELLSDFEAYSQKQPLIATLAATAVGFTISRALKASSTRRFQDGSGQ